MPFQHRLAGRGDRELSPGQESACARAESGKRLTEHERGTLRSAALYASPKDASRAEAALEADRTMRGGRA